MIILLRIIVSNLGLGLSVGVGEDLQFLEVDPEVHVLVQGVVIDFGLLFLLSEPFFNASNC